LTYRPNILFVVLPRLLKEGGEELITRLKALTRVGVSAFLLEENPIDILHCGNTASFRYPAIGVEANDLPARPLRRGHMGENPVMVAVLTHIADIGEDLRA
jgi:hypothetical protein